MEKLAKKIANNISDNLDYDDEKSAVIAYGLIAIFQMALIFLLTSIVGVLLGFWTECMIVFLSVGFLRKSTGGAHSSTFSGCICISTISICTISAISKYLFPQEWLFPISIAIALCYSLTFFVTYMLAPVDNPKKPIKRKEKIARLRRNAMITLTVYALLTVTAIYFSIKYPSLLSLGISLTLSCLWQTLMMTKSGARLIEFVDHKILHN